MYELFITNKNYSSWSLRSWLLCTERDIPFSERLLPLPHHSAGAAFKGSSPSGRVPCLRDGETVVWDSMAIAEYLAERHAGVWPADPVARAWARSASAEMHAGFFALRNECSMNCGLRVRLCAPSDALRADVSRIDELWSEGLARFGGPFLAGDAFTAVDASFAPVAFRIQTYGLATDAFGLGAAASAYASRILALPGMQAWYAAGIAETDREPGHEEEAQRVGSVLEDLRANG